MSARVISRPPDEHSCRIGKKLLTVTEAEADEQNWLNPHVSPPSHAGTFVIADLELRALPDGSVVACEKCGKVWVKDPGGHSIYGVDNSWRPEKRRERRRRLRREAAQ